VLQQGDCTGKGVSAGQIQTALGAAAFGKDGKGSLPVMRLLVERGDMIGAGAEWAKELMAQKLKEADLDFVRVLMQAGVQLSSGAGAGCEQGNTALILQEV
jgi:hypothetical protein